MLVSRSDLLDGPRQAQPARAIPRRGGDQLAEQHHAVAEIVALEGIVEFAADLGDRLAGSASLALDLRFKLERGFGEIRPFERLVGGDGQGRRENGHKGDERGKDAGADEHEHGRDPPDRSASPTKRATVQAEF